MSAKKAIAGTWFILQNASKIYKLIFLVRVSKYRSFVATLYIFIIYAIFLTVNHHCSAVYIVGRVTSLEQLSLAELSRIQW